jgi:hypothetical protein
MPACYVKHERGFIHPKLERILPPLRPGLAGRTAGSGDATVRIEGRTRGAAFACATDADACERCAGVTLASRALRAEQLLQAIGVGRIGAGDRHYASKLSRRLIEFGNFCQLEILPLAVGRSYRRVAQNFLTEVLCELPPMSSGGAREFE